MTKKNVMFSNEIKDYLIKFNGTNEFHEELFFEYSDDLPF